MPLTKPPGIENDAFKSAKWDELTQGRAFRQSDAPTLKATNCVTGWCGLSRENRIFRR